MRKSSDWWLPEIILRKNAGVAMHQQIRSQLAQAIRRAAPGTQLPSTRVLAKLLGVSRNTVLTAYEELVADGLIEGRHGSAMFVSEGVPRELVALNPLQLLREAQYPLRSLTIVDQDGTPLYLSYLR